MAAATAAEAGAAVELLDAAEWAGGRLALQTQPLQGPATIYGGLSGVEFCEGLADDSVSAGAVLRLGVEVKDVRALDPPTSGFELALSCAGGAARLRSRAVVLATGSLESWLDVPGLPLRGAALSGDVQAGLNRAGVRPGRRVVMAGSDNAGLLIAANLLGAGVEVVAVVDESPSVVGREVNAAPLRDAGVELLPSTRLVEVHGTERVEAVTVDATGARRTLRADCLCMAGPRRPDTAARGQPGPAHAAIAGDGGRDAGARRPPRRGDCGCVRLRRRGRGRKRRGLAGERATRRSRGGGLRRQPTSRFRAADQAWRVDGWHTCGAVAEGSSAARRRRRWRGQCGDSGRHPHPNLPPARGTGTASPPYPYRVRGRL